MSDDVTPPPRARMSKRMTAEAIGTFWLVLGGCGTAVLATGDGGVGTIGVALAFGLTVFTMAFAVGAISGGHFNPAVTIGLTAAGRFPAREVPAYVAAQVAGAIIASFALLFIVHSLPGFEIGGFATNGYATSSPKGYPLLTAFMVEMVLTAAFLMVILGATDERSLAAFAPLAIGLALTLIHLLSIPITNTSVNPARSTGPALILGGIALTQLWLFWLAPVLGAVLAGGVGRWLFSHADDVRSPGPISVAKLDRLVDPVTTPTATVASTSGRP